MFAGPTLARARKFGIACLDGIEVRPPIRRGELESLVRASASPRTAIIVDGVFHLGQLAVSHAEIRTAIERGWQVWGTSSMGAIRAAEMLSLGMRGFGAVFERFRDDPDFRDDEVTLLHEPEEPYREISEPLVHMRVAIAELVARGELAADASVKILDELGAMWFGARTLPVLRERLLASGVAAATVTGMVDHFDRYRIKALDLRDLLAQRPFERGAS